LPTLENFLESLNIFPLILTSGELNTTLHFEEEKKRGKHIDKKAHSANRTVYKTVKVVGGNIGDFAVTCKFIISIFCVT
jgi:hypothetical protein